VVSEGDLVIITGGTPVGVSGTTNTMKIQVVGDILLRGKGLCGGTVTAAVHVVADDDLNRGPFNAGDIIVIRETGDEIIPVLKDAAAIITEEPEEVSRAVTVAKALNIPIIVEAPQAAAILKSGTVVTVDADRGLVLSGF